MNENKEACVFAFDIRAYESGCYAELATLGTRLQGKTMSVLKGSLEAESKLDFGWVLRQGVQ